MRNALFATLLILPTIARADTISGAVRYFPLGERQYGFQIQPLAVPGIPVGYQLDFFGLIYFGIGGAAGLNLNSGNTISTVDFTGTVAFTLIKSIQPSKVLSFDHPVSTSFAFKTTYNNFSNTSLFIPYPVRLSGNSGLAPIAPDLFSSYTFAAVEFYDTLNGYTTPAGSTASFSNGFTDFASATGNLIVTVTYVSFASVPEPASIIIVGTGLLTLIGKRRQRRDPGRQECLPS